MFTVCSEYFQSIFRVCLGYVSFRHLAHLVCQFLAFFQSGVLCFLSCMYNTQDRSQSLRKRSNSQAGSTTLHGSFELFITFDHEYVVRSYKLFMNDQLATLFVCHNKVS